MPIELFSGLPGNGKTAFMVERLADEAKKAERPLFAAGIDGLAPGLATVLEDPRSWNDVLPGVAGSCECDKAPPGHAHKVPDGSLIFVDEAWKWFGHLHDAGRQANPPHVLQLAEHRHRGIDFVWTTQAPAQLYPFARTLIARHTHVVRRFGTHFCDLYSWEELNEEIKSVARRENASKALRRLPEHVFTSYRSATQHTIKRRLPFKMFVLPVAIVLSIGAIWFAYNYLKPESMSARLAGKVADAAPAAAATASNEPPASTPSRPATVDEYIKLQQPRIALAPWSAPLYDERGATVDPSLYCMSAGAGDGEGEACKCLTEQGTRYEVPRQQCEDQARNGPMYNPFRERVEESSESAGVQDAQDAEPGAAAQRVFGMGQAGASARYGQFRNEPQGPERYWVGQ